MQYLLTNTGDETRFKFMTKDSLLLFLIEQALSNFLSVASEADLKAQWNILEDIKKQDLKAILEYVNWYEIIVEN